MWDDKLIEQNKLESVGVHLALTRPVWVSHFLLQLLKIRLVSELIFSLIAVAQSSGCFLKGWCKGAIYSIVYKYNFFWTKGENVRYNQRQISDYLRQKEWIFGYLHWITTYNNGFRVNNVKYLQ